MAIADIDPAIPLQFVERIAALPTPDEVIAAFRREAGRYGYTTFALGSGPWSGPEAPPPFFVATWPQDWVETYAGEGFAALDPNIPAARDSLLPVTWSELRERHRNDPAVLRAMDATAAHGWPEGLTIPVHGPHGYHGLVVLAGETRDLPVRHRAALHMMGLYLHERLRELIVPSAPAVPPALSAGERECILLLVHGLTDGEIADRLNIATATAHWRIERAKKKLGVRTRAQLAALAVHRGLIRP
jgi:LuxR family quorum sensing-dependent transcriptional regulator